MSRPTPLPPRLKDEPPLWYARFKKWLLLPLPRAVLEVYNLEREEKGKKRQESPPGSWRDIPTKYKWASRAEEWDKQESERISLELSEKREKQRERELEAAQLLYQTGKTNISAPMVDQNFKKYGIDGKVTEERNIFGSPAAVRVAITALVESSNQARKALEMVDKKTGMELTGKDSGPVEVKDVTLSDQERADRIAALLDRAREARGGLSSAGSGDEADLASRIPKPGDE